VRALVRSVPWDDERWSWAEQLTVQLCSLGVPAEIVADRVHDGYDTQIRAFETQIKLGDDVWHFEDDALLGEGFAGRARLHELYAGGALIQGFNLNHGGKDRDTGNGNGWEPGRLFSSTVCYRLPLAWAPSLIDPRRDSTRKSYTFLG
jgi:hypothetical protein